MSKMSNLWVRKNGYSKYEGKFEPRKEVDMLDVNIGDLVKVLTGYDPNKHIVNNFNGIREQDEADLSTLKKREAWMAICHDQSFIVDHMPNQDVPLHLRDREDKLEKLEGILAETLQKHAVVASGISKDLDSGLPEQTLQDALRTVWWTQQRIERLTRDIKDLKAEVPEQVDDPDAKVVEDFNMHWVMAKQRAQHILDWLLKKGDSVRLPVLHRLVRYLDRSYSKGSMSSWYYYVISLEAFRLMKPLIAPPAYRKEVIRLNNFAAKKALTYKKKGFGTFGPPKPRDPVYVDVEPTYMSERTLSEDELIDAIDRRHKYMDKYK